MTAAGRAEPTEAASSTSQPCRRARKLGILKWWEVTGERPVPKKLCRPRQFVPQPIAVQASVSLKARKNCPISLPPLAEANTSSRKIPAAHEV